MGLNLDFKSGRGEATAVATDGTLSNFSTALFVTSSQVMTSLGVSSETVDTRDVVDTLSLSTTLSRLT